MADDAKRKILERRAQFVAAAIGSSIMAASCEQKPHVCLKVAHEMRDAGAAPSPADAAMAMPCLEPMPPRDAEPVVCLSVAMPPDAGPRPIPIACLSPMPHWDAGTAKPPGAPPKACLKMSMPDDE